MIAVKLGKYLNTRTAIQNRLSNRIYPNRAPQTQKELPYAIVTTVSGSPDYSLTGEIADLAKIVQVDVYSQEYIHAVEIADLIRQEISFFDGTWDETVVKSCTVENELDLSLPPVDASDAWLFRRTINYRVTYVR